MQLQSAFVPFVRVSLATLVLALIGLTASCGGGDAVKRYYTLENRTAIDGTATGAPLCSRSLVVAAVDVASPYDQDKIVFRSDSLEVRYYNLRHWVSPPDEMFAKLLSRRLEAEHLFAAVDSSVQASRDHLSLFARLHRLEEVDRGQEWHARLAMSMVLKDDRTDAVLWRHEFDVTRKASDNEIRRVIAALNELYNEQMDVAIASLRTHLQQRGCPD